VPRVKLVCGRVGDDGDGMAVQLSRPALRLLLGPAARVDRQLVCLHGAGNRSPTRRGGGVRISGSRRVSWPTPQSKSGAEAGLVVRGGDLSKGVPSSRELVGGTPNRSGTGRHVNEGLDKGPRSSSS
jgi:hypothetical protein